LPQVRIDSQGNVFIFSYELETYYSTALLDLNKSLTGDSSGELASALEKEANATRTLVGSFLHLSNKSHTRLFDNSHFLESYKATTAVIYALSMLLVEELKIIFRLQYFSLKLPLCAPNFKKVKMNVNISEFSLLLQKTDLNARAVRLYKR